MLDDRVRVCGNIQFMQVDICQQGTEDTALWRSAVCAVVLPILQVTCFQPHPQEVEQSTILNVSCKDLHQDFMVDVIEASANVAFNEPRRALNSYRIFASAV